MVLSWTRRKGFRRTRKEKDVADADLDRVVVIPSHFRCPISLDLMKDPVTLDTGITYDRDNIDKWIESGNQTCPVTNQILRSFEPIPNHTIRRRIQDWCVDNQSYGFERISTPRVPVSPSEVNEVCSKIMAATQKGDDKKCQEMVRKIKVWGKESERNKKCIVNTGTSSVLCNSFESFAVSTEKHASLLEDMLEVLTWILQSIAQEGRSKLLSAVSLRCMVWFLNVKNLTVRQNTAAVLKELACFDDMHMEAMVQIEGFTQGLVRLIAEPVGPKATKACLTTMLFMVTSKTCSKRIISTTMDLDLISLLLELIVDSEKSICEKALGVLDGLCDSEECVAMAKSNALVVPLMVKKILRVSDFASKFSVSILWKLCRHEDEDSCNVLMEALQVGAFQKLLVLLQVGCGESTKEKASELLKLLNACRRKLECVDTSSDQFKNLKKSF